MMDGCQVLNVHSESGDIGESLAIVKQTVATDMNRKFIEIRDGMVVSDIKDRTASLDVKDNFSMIAKHSDAAMAGY